MPHPVEPRLDLATLSRLLEAVEPAALLVPPPLVRSIIKRDRGLPGMILRVPHRKGYVIGRDALLALVTRDELGLAPKRDLPPLVLLLAAPQTEAIGELTLVKYWRLLFHLRIHRAIAEIALTDAAVRERVRRIGQAEFDEIRTVLREERLLLPPRDDRAAYEEFAAFYLELRYFARPLVPHYFPSIEDFEPIDRLLAEDVDADQLFAACRLAGAPDPTFAVDELDSTPSSIGAGSVSDGHSHKGSSLTRPAPTHDAGRGATEDLLARAAAASGVGNNVRAAIDCAQANDAVRAAQELDHLVDRLRPALQLSDADALAWRTALTALLSPAAEGTWPAEARLLYDLQKVCIDHERPVFLPDLMEWAYSGFRRPLVRPLPNQPLVLAVKHLRSASDRLPAVRLAADVRRALADLLRKALHHTEERLRDCFRPQLSDALSGVGLRPHNFPERVARDKVVEELLDLIAERGFLKLGDLRDALARNGLKLPDLADPVELVVGDPLLRANRELAGQLPGVYRRGEVYLRWLQRGSAVAFGTHPGRLFVRYVALPVGGAYATIVFAQEMLHIVRLPHHLTRTGLATAVGILTVFYLMLLHWPTFRHTVVEGFRAIGKGLFAVFIDLPSAALRLPVIRRLLDSRWGRAVQDAVADWTVRPWDYVRTVVPGLARLFVDAFKTALEALDRALYAVDEWLRFRGGEGRAALVAKTVFGFVWFLIAYVVRLYVNVFLEPTVNPLKHFPAVTVAAKLLVPFWIPLTELMAIPLLFLGKPIAYALAFLALHALPGAAGFLVWELKENWRLYAANRPENLGPVAVGHHGEALPQLLRPGFHAGTLPKLYAKVRKAERRAVRSGDWKPARKLHAELHHIEEAVRHFAERDLLATVNGSRNWSVGPLQLAAVEAGSVRIRLVLACPALGDGPFELAFEEQSGRLLARVADRLARQAVRARGGSVVAVRLSGFYKVAGVDLVGEQIDASFTPVAPSYDIANGRLIVWPTDDVEVAYDLTETPVLHPQVMAGQPACSLPTLEARRLLFGDRAVPWRDWVAAWGARPGGRRPTGAAGAWCACCLRSGRGTVRRGGEREPSRASTRAMADVAIIANGGAGVTAVPPIHHGPSPCRTHSSVNAACFMLLPPVTK
ncbi:MAG: hypothetical protein U0746_06155 [Gemmataceae bacterium]